MQRSELSIAFIVCIATLSVNAPLAADDLENAPAETTQTPAATPSAPTATSAAAKSNYNNRQICQSQTVIGSRIPRLTCTTQSQMDARRKADQAWKQSLDLRQDRLPPPGGGVVGG